MGKLTKKQYAIIIIVLIASFIYNYNNFGSSKSLFNPLNIVFYGLAVIVIIFVIRIIITKRVCPNCGTKLSAIRIPQNANEALYGWTTCPKCKAEIDNYGQIVNRGQ